MSKITPEKLYQYGAVMFVPVSEAAAIEKAKTEKVKAGSGSAGTSPVATGDRDSGEFTYSYQGQSGSLFEQSDELPGYLFWYDQGGTMKQYRIDVAKAQAEADKASTKAAQAAAVAAEPAQAKPGDVPSAPAPAPSPSVAPAPKK